ncbi:unnamed protein product, partial [Rotaria sp. Silwood1]
TYDFFTYSGNTFISRGSVTCGAICNFVGGRRCSVVGSTASCTGLLVHRDSGGYYDILVVLLLLVTVLIILIENGHILIDCFV